MMNLLLTGSVKADDFCTSAQSIIQVIGWVVTIFRIVVPLLIIVLGIFSLGKAAISSKPEDIKKNIGGLIWRFVGGIAIFFLPSIIMTVFGFFTQWTAIENKMDFKTCKDCLLAPWSCHVVDDNATY